MLLTFICPMRPLLSHYGRLMVRSKVEVSSLAKHHMWTQHNRNTQSYLVWSIGIYVCWFFPFLGGFERKTMQELNWALFIYKVLHQFPWYLPASFGMLQAIMSFGHLAWSDPYFHWTRWHFWVLDTQHGPTVDGRNPAAPGMVKIL